MFNLFKSLEPNARHFFSSTERIILSHLSK